jgi:myosin heavy subunit
MVRMGDVNEATILHNLRARFVEDVVYTNIGSILVSINPFTWIPGLYSSELIEEHLNLPPGEISTPHVFQIAAAAFHGLRNEQANQAIIISGESGAGKTEATKKCLQFFAEAAGSAEKSSGMDGKLLSANPILEAFGNAKTVRNNNSSRFGKWMEVHFNVRAQICGSQIINYLLEKSRVVFQAPNERNYHIFYMLCVAAPAEMRAKLALGPADNYNFVNKSGCIVVDGLNDVHEFKDLMAAFKELEFNDADIEILFTMVAGLLHLSNVTFEAVDADTCRMSGSADVRTELGHAAALLGVTPEALQLAMEQKLIETRNERVRSPLSVEKAVDGRNSMAKAIYGRQFDWLVQKVNSSMEGALSDSKNVIGAWWRRPAGWRRGGDERARQRGGHLTPSAAAAPHCLLAHHPAPRPLLPPASPPLHSRRCAGHLRLRDL